jgi:hypothetical protein
MSIAPVICQICKKPKSPHNGMIAELIRPSLLEFIKKKVPDLDSKACICFEDLGDFRKDYVKEVLEEEIGELSALDHEVIQSLEQHEILSADISKQFDKKLTFGERLSDRIAEFGGSWKFIMMFVAVLIGWNCAERCFSSKSRLRSVSVHSSQPDSLVLGCDPGANHYDESKSS